MGNDPTTTTPDLDVDLVRIAYQIYFFIEATGRSHLHEIPRELGLSIEYIYHNYPRPDQLGTVPASRPRRRAGSAEPLDYPYHWATDVTAFRRSVRAFTDRTINYRRLPQLQAYVRSQDPPSTGTTPIRALSPEDPAPDQAEAQGNTSSTTPDSTTTRNITTRDTSESAVMDEAAVRRIVNEAVQAAAVQFAAVTAGSQTAGSQAANRSNAAEGATAPTPTISTSRWNANELGFFDPHYDDKTVHSDAPIEHTGKDTYFRDIHLFLDRVKQFVPSKGEIVRENL